MSDFSHISKKERETLGKNGHQPFLMLELEVRASPAFRSLGKNSIHILLCFLGKLKFAKLNKNEKKRGKRLNRKCLNGDELVMTYVELQNPPWNFGQGTIRRAFAELREKGFIEIVYRGGACKQDKNIYKISNNWRLWREGNNYDKRVKDAHRGYQKH